MASVGLSLSGQPSALAPGPCGSGGAGTARQLDFSTNLLLGGGGADSEDEDLFGAKSRQAAAELGAQHAAAQTLPSGSSEVEAASPGLLESGPPASAAPAASAVSQVPSEPPAPNTEQVTTPSPPRARDLAPSAATSVGDVAPRAVDAVPITPPARQEQQRATSSAPLPPRPAAPPDRVLASAPGAMPPPAPRLTPQPVSLGGGAALTRRPLGGQLTSLIGSGAFGPAPTPALSPQLASSRLLAAPARRAGSSPLVHGGLARAPSGLASRSEGLPIRPGSHALAAASLQSQRPAAAHRAGLPAACLPSPRAGPLHAAPPEAVPGGERERIGTGAAATSPVQARIGLSPESADGAGISDGAQRLQISPATLKLSKQSREQVPTLNKMKQQLHRFQTQFAQMTNEALLEAWDPETEYAMHRLREELLAVKQAEHDADANSDDPMDIDDEAPVHAQLTKELEMRSPSGAAASRMETEAPSPAASCSVVARPATVAVNEGTHPRRVAPFRLRVPTPPPRDSHDTGATVGRSPSAAGNAGSVERFRGRAKGVMSGAEGRGRGGEAKRPRAPRSGPSCSATNHEAGL